MADYIYHKDPLYRMESWILPQIVSLLFFKEPEWAKTQFYPNRVPIKGESNAIKLKMKDFRLHKECIEGRLIT